MSGRIYKGAHASATSCWEVLDWDFSTVVGEDEFITGIVDDRALRYARVSVTRM